MAKPRTLLDALAAERHAAAGLAEYPIAATLGVSADTFTKRKRKRDQPGIAEALARGRQSATGRIENAAYTCALQAVGDPRYQASMIFWLNAGCKERTVIETVSTDDAGDSREALLARVHALAGRVRREPAVGRARRRALRAGPRDARTGRPG